MAEIPIERKKGTNWLPLIIGVLVVLALLGWWASRNRDARAATRASDPSATVAPTPNPNSNPGASNGRQ